MSAVVVHATDFSDTAAAAEAQAIAMARALDAELVLVHVASEGMLYGEVPFGRGDLERVYAAQRDWARGQLEERTAVVRAAGIRARAVLRIGAAAEEIVTLAGEEGAAMIVLGTHGRGGLERLMLGSVADRVLRAARCPVLTVRTPAA